MNIFCILAVVTALTGNWEFRKTLDANSNRVDETWRTVTVPHDWAIAGPFQMTDKMGRWTGALPWRGAGEYRRTVSPTEEDLDNLHMDGRAYLEFDGVMGRSEVYLNGEKVGGGTYGYLGYKIDVTKKIRKGPNEILVKTSTFAQGSRWYPGAGIFRAARLRVCPHPHPIPDTLNIRCEKLTDEAAEMYATYETPWGPEFRRWTVENPRRWSLEDPYRYEMDIYGFKFPYGIREARFDAEKGFFLNGKRVQLKGVDLHSDLGPLGMAVDRSALLRQLLAMKSMGVNAIRTSHNCPDPLLLDLCDEMGLLVWDECFDKWDATAGRLPSEKLEDYVVDHLKRFVRRDRNHPCVIVWSIGNEIDKASASYADGTTRARCKLFRDAVRSEDETRPVGIGACRGEGTAFADADRLWSEFGLADARKAGEAATLRFRVDPFQPDDPAALRFLQVEAADAKGVAAPFAEPTVRFTLEGPGEIVAVGNSDEHGATSFRNFQAFPLRFGKALVIVRRAGEGVMTLIAEAKGLKPARYDFGGVVTAGLGEAGIKAAQVRVRELKARQPNEPWTVILPKGEIRLESPLAFGKEDAGRPGAPVVWKGAGVIIRGGVDVGPWTDEGAGVVSASIPRDADGRPLALDMLFVNGNRASRSVLPKNRGSFRIPGGEFDSRAKTFSTNAEGRVTYAKEWTRVKEDAATVLDAVAPEDLPYVQMQVRFDWTQARRRVVAWDRAKREVVTEAFGGRPRDANNRWCERAALRFENLRAAFTDPGDWFYDAKNGKILYRLRAGETAAALKAIAPAKRLSKLLVADGLHDVRFEGLAFEYADAPQGGTADDPRKFNQTYRCQSAGTYDATVELRYAERVEFIRCRVGRSGNYAFRIADGCRHIALRRCETWDTGAGGIWMGSAEMHFPGGCARRRMIQPTEPESCAYHVIEDCRLRHGGRFNPEGTAIFVTHCSDSRIEHNEIEDWYYSGITIGYTWGYGGSPSQRNTIAYNRLSHLGQRELSDMGGIYTLAPSFGTVVRNNVITDVYGFDTAAWGLYADEGSEGIVFENNVISHTEFGGINQHYGSGCIFRNNIVAYNDLRGCLSVGRREAMGVPSSIHITGNIFYTAKGPLACRGSMEVGGIWAHNVWWKEGGPAKDDFDLRSAEEFLASGRAYGDVVADPLFVDAKNGDFRLKPDSPALKLGFRPWNHALAGPRP